MVNACAMVEGENIPLVRGRIGVSVPKKDEDRGNAVTVIQREHGKPVLKNASSRIQRICFVRIGH